jgi:hypothetical protein
MRTAKEFQMASWALIRDLCEVLKTAMRAVKALKTAKRAAEAY